MHAKHIRRSPSAELVPTSDEMYSTVRIKGDLEDSSADMFGTVRVKVPCSSA
jgi:hypothetical protein